MNPAPPVIRYNFEPLVIISDEDCMERMIFYFNICGEMYRKSDILRNKMLT